MTTTEQLALLPAERRLLDAAVAGELCDLIDVTTRPTRDEMVEWDDPDRTIRADFLAQLITNRFPAVHVDKVAVHGASITGTLDVAAELDIVALDLRFCRFDELRCNEAAFAGDIRFDGAAFEGDVRFDKVVFGGSTWFTDATFTGPAWFDGATFAGETGFDRAAFTRNARFDKVDFPGPLGSTERSSLEMLGSTGHCSLGAPGLTG